MRVLGASLWAAALLLPSLLPAAPRAARHDPTAALTLIFSGEQSGQLTPCGCSKPMLGGLPRRASYLRSLSPGPLVKAENGDLTQALGRQDELKAETLVEMLNLLDYDAINLGEKDFRLGITFLQALQKRFHGAFLCANARKADGGPLFRGYTIVERQVGGRPARVVLVGLLSDQYREAVERGSPGVRLEQPTAAMERLQAQLPSSGESRVLLFHGSKAEAEQLARRFHAFSLVLFAHEGDQPAASGRVGSVALAACGKEGKYLGRAVFAPGSPGGVTSVESAALTPGFADDPGVMQLEETYLNRVTAEDLLARVPRSPTDNGDAFAGSAACAGCHQAAHRTWTATPHARAMQTLAQVKHQRDPDCVGCHAVGLERQGGFTSPEQTPHLQDVGCESRHGPATRHVQNPTMALPKAGEAACAPCHVPQHSPNFDFARYWERIRH